MAEAWSYLQQGKTLGPVTEETLRGLLATGQLSLDDLVWNPGLSDWTPAGRCPELQPSSPRIALDLPPALPPPIAPTPIFPSNPFAMGEAAPSARSAKAAVTGAMVALRATKPWVRFLGVLGILGTILMAVGALVVMGMTSGPLRGMPAGVRMILPLVYLLMAGLQVPPVLFLNRYASRIADLLQSEAPEDLVRALEAQKSFWKYVGIMTLIVLIFYVLIFAAVIVAAVLGGARHML